MLSLVLLAGALVCLFVPPLMAWAPLMLLLLFSTNTLALWLALGLAGVALVLYLYRSLTT